MQAVIFDFYGTLAETPDWGPSWDQLIAETGYELTDDVRDRWWNDGFDGVEHDEHSRSRDHYVAWQRARTSGMLTDCGVPAELHDTLIARVRDIGAHRRMRAYDDAVPVLAELRARGYALAVCSNWDWDLTEAVESAGLAGRVDVLVSSAWVGARKPHPRVYDAVLARIGAGAGDAVFVGDTWTCDVEGPLAAGMRPVYVRRPHFGPDPTAPAATGGACDAVIRSTDLHAVLAAVS